MVDRLSGTAVMFRLNTDTPEGKALSKSFHLNGIPTTVVLDPAGEEVDRIIGYDSRSAWTKTLLAYLYGVDTLQDLLGRAQTVKGADLRRDIASKYLERGDAKNALAWVDKAHEAMTPEDAGLSGSLSLIRGRALLIDDPAKGEAELNELVRGKDADAADEAFGALSSYYRKAVRAAKTPEATAQAKKAMMDLYHVLLPTRQDDVSFLNGYAWHAAEEGVELDQALAAAQRAVTLSGDDTGILDTLAEVYYKMGNRADALESIGKALAKSPEDEYLLGQKKKFEAMPLPKKPKGAGKK